MKELQSWKTQVQAHLNMPHSHSHLGQGAANKLSTTASIKTEPGLQCH